jgi:hypothetical protein
MKEYFMYGILIPESQFKAWEDGTGRKFPIGIYGNLYCKFDSRDGKFVIVGKKLKRINDDNPILVPIQSANEETKIEIEVATEFGFKGNFHYYFIKNYE